MSTRVVSVAKSDGIFSFLGPVELSAEIDPRIRDDSLLGDVSGSVATPSLSGCHLAYLRFVSCLETDA